MNNELIDALKAARLYIKGEALPTKVQVLDIIGHALDGTPAPRTGSSTRYCPACEQQRVVPDAPAASGAALTDKDRQYVEGLFPSNVHGLTVRAIIDCVLDRAVLAAQPVASGAALTDTLSAIGWLYRRLPRGYGRQSHIESVIAALAEVTGQDSGDFLLDQAAQPASTAAKAAEQADLIARLRRQLDVANDRLTDYQDHNGPGAADVRKAAVDGEYWQYCITHGFPQLLSSGWWARLPNGHLIKGESPETAVAAAIRSLNNKG
ncbi:hypothetical protein [Massilia sp. CCM 8734]|uniref:hypothetical protein n=1 Tax=Massilia sp. CCM 8734 TaxID=2609283 RepID=UPI001422A27C|nr:hypothetical protein [Massilia sp. CCM 8734]NHZ94630.1 hypothetical protein [Massilia sp. CCM 8734]